MNIKALTIVTLILATGVTLGLICASASHSAEKPNPKPDPKSEWWITQNDTRQRWKADSRPQDCVSRVEFKSQGKTVILYGSLTIEEIR